MDSVWEQTKLETRKMPKNAAYPPGDIFPSVIAGVLMDFLL